MNRIYGTELEQSNLRTLYDNLDRMNERFNPTEADLADENSSFWEWKVSTMTDQKTPIEMISHKEYYEIFVEMMADEIFLDTHAFG